MRRLPSHPSPPILRVTLVTIFLCGAPAAASAQVAAPRLPAWETDWERRARRQKDSLTQLNAYRRAHPELYEVTTPPLQPVRLYAEYEPVDAVYLAWMPGSFDDYFAELSHEVLSRTSAAMIILHSGTAARTIIDGFLTSAGVDPADASFLDLMTAGAHYEWQTEWPYDNALESFWTVDFGPFFVADGAGVLAAIDPRYYVYRVNDDAVASKVSAGLGLNVYRPDLGWEGGNLLSDGEGTCFASAMHIVENLPREQGAIEDDLFAYLGCEKTIWLEPPLGETTGHLDMWFRNASATTLVIAEYAANIDPANAAILDRNAALLQSETTAAGTAFDVLRVPMPSNAGGVWRTYTNLIVVNDLVLVPTYAQYRTHEAEALAVFAAAFPGRSIVALDSDDIIRWGGAIHCVTRTRPAGQHQALEAPPTPACGGEFDCTPGCGHIDYSGDCQWGLPVYCDAGEVAVDVCESSQRCGWLLDGGYFDCVNAGCTGLAPEGRCTYTAEGDAVAVACSAEGFALGERCPEGTACALDASANEVACLNANCTDECGINEGGCTPEGDSWDCDEAGDGDICLDIVVTACDGASCSGGRCQCSHECVAGQGLCLSEVNGWVCGEAGDGDACSERIPETCRAGESCVAGRCGGPRPQCGCQSTSPGAPLVFLLVLLPFWGRRRCW